MGLHNQLQEALNAAQTTACVNIQYEINATVWVLTPQWIATEDDVRRAVEIVRAQLPEGDRIVVELPAKLVLEWMVPKIGADLRVYLHQVDNGVVTARRDS